MRKFFILSLFVVAGVLTGPFSSEALARKVVVKQKVVVAANVAPGVAVIKSKTVIKGRR